MKFLNFCNTRDHQRANHYLASSIPGPISGPTDGHLCAIDQVGHDFRQRLARVVSQLCGGRSTPVCLALDSMDRFMDGTTHLFQPAVEDE
jgi:hypothetical protein